MKKLLIILTLPLLVFVSCNGNNSYTMETFYSENKSNGDTMLTGKKDVIKASSDSAAYLEAAEKFKALMSKAGDDGMPVNFTLRDNKGTIVTGPGMINPDVKEQMYPNQKP